MKNFVFTLYLIGKFNLKLNSTTIECLCLVFLDVWCFSFGVLDIVFNNNCCKQAIRTIISRIRSSNIHSPPVIRDHLCCHFQFRAFIGYYHCINIMDLPEEFRRLEEHFNISIGNFSSRLQRAIDTSGNDPYLNHLQEDFSAFKQNITGALNDIRKIFVNFDDRIEALENDSRKTCILVHGVAETEDEVPLLLVENVIAIMKLESHLPSEKCIDDVHRLGRPTGQNNSKPRPLLVTFTKFSYKNSMWSAKRKLKGSGILITEFLTRKRQKLYGDARTAFGSQNVWTQNGYIHAAVGKRKIKISSLSQIHELRSAAVGGAEAARSQNLPTKGSRPNTRSKNVSK